MKTDEITTTLQQVFDRVFLDRVELRPDLSAKDVPEWDSMIHISLVVAVEQAFGVRFRLGEVEATQNIGEFVELIGKRLKG
jgi:acyl carrier protein